MLLLGSRAFRKARLHTYPAGSTGGTAVDTVDERAAKFELADQQIALARPARQELGQSSVADRGRDVGTEQMCARERNVDAFGDKGLVARGCFV